MTFPGRATIWLDRICLVASSCIGASHGASAVDVVLGCFRFSINSPKNRDVATELLVKVTRVLWHERDGNVIKVGGLGFIMRPEMHKITAPMYKAEYQALIDHINSLIKDATI